VTIGDDGREYTTLIDEIFDEGNFSILQPFYRGKSVELEPGQEYKFTCVKGGGLHYFNAMVIRSDVSGSVSVVYVRYTGNYLRLQRRNAYRSRIALDIEVRKKAQGKQLPEDWSSAKTIDISESGMRVRLGPRFEQGDILECNIRIDRYGIFTVLPTVGCIIKRASPLQNKAGESICGIAFTEIDPKSKNYLLKLITLSQRNPLTR